MQTWRLAEVGLAVHNEEVTDPASSCSCASQLPATTNRKMSQADHKQHNIAVCYRQRKAQHAAKVTQLLTFRNACE